MAIAFGREGADVLIGYLPVAEDDAQETRRPIEVAGRTAVLFPGDMSANLSGVSAAAAKQQLMGSTAVVAGVGFEPTTFRL